MRIAIVNDMLMALEALRRSVARRAGWEIAWIARDGAEAAKKCAVDTPDIILMDLIMPVMNGAEATRQIMRDSPCAILVVTATVEGNMQLVFEAMGHGALDAINTPVLGADGKLTGATKLEGKIDLISKLIGRGKQQHVPAPVALGDTVADNHQLPPLIVIGSSTGGPAALLEIFKALPTGFPAAIVVVQHVDISFSADLANWLGQQSPSPVKVAEPGCQPEKGIIWIAGTNDHLIMTAERKLTYCAEPKDVFYRPSVDVFFHSVAANWMARGTAVVLTGMGRDGADGLLSLRKSGWRTIAQDKKTSVVFGMPKAAAECAAALKIMPIDRIAQELIYYLPNSE
ncbi:MAG: chemotaxis-specific protein-glutamate methyltransferase CheB [Kiritimatiellia bacterium]|nr:chemotaxis-specific protein-glutamate methyltransferase CheB [Kiritimatiellia bacterium]